MGRTIADILDNDLGLGEATQDKTASAQTAPETDEIEKLAMEIGLVTESDSANANETQEQIKEASMSLAGMYGTMFPEDVAVVGTGTQEKTASQDKEAAAVEEAMGEVAYDSYVTSFDGQITKIAEELKGSATVGGAAGDAHPQAMKNNEDASEAKIDTTPQVQGGSEMGTSPKGAVGKFEHKSAPMGEMKHAALRKAWLQSLLTDAE